MQTRDIMNDLINEKVILDTIEKEMNAKSAIEEKVNNLFLFYTQAAESCNKAGLQDVNTICKTFFNGAFRKLNQKVL